MVAKLDVPTVVATMSKRGDIQGLRAVAIFSVLLFHIWPEKYRNGFLGVDIFFVISGFIMAMILCREPLTLKSVQKFYISRIRRIVPIYIVVVALTLAAAMYLFYDAEIRELEMDALPAALFYTNVEEMSRKTNYFSQVSEFRLLLHTWSLAVEVQYYLIVPAIFAVLTRIPSNLAMLICLLALAASIIFQVKSPKEVAFGHLLSRIWQFMAGTLAYLMSKNFEHWKSAPKQTNCEELGALLDEESGAKKVPFNDLRSIRNRYPSKECATACIVFMISSLLLVILICCTLREAAIPEGLQRPLIVSLTTLTILVGALHENYLLRNPLMVWIGDISYTVYLVHWPVILFRRYWSVEKTFTQKEGLFLIAITFLLTIALDVCVDTQFRKLKRVKQVLLAIASVYALFTVAFLLLPTRYDRNETLTKETRGNYRQLIELLNDNATGKAQAATLSREAKINLNYYLTRWSTEMFECPDSRPYWQHKLNTSWLGDVWECKFLGNGTKRAFIIGNSHARQLMHGIAKAYKDVYAELYVYTITYCSPLKELEGKRDKRCDAFADSLPVAVVT
ncbi:Protein OAC-10, partial [Aphelenchoides avenae]